MGQVDFISPRIGRTWAISCRNPKPISLLKLALLSNVPLPFNCNTGVCGSCAVRVAPARGKRQLCLNSFERYTLRGLDKLPQALVGGDCKDWKQPQWRLACQCIVDTGDQFFVAF